MRLFVLIMGVALSASVLGCRASTAEVRGVVTLRGAAPRLPGLVIHFLAPDGRVVSALVAEDGTYRAVGVPVGPVQIAFSLTSEEEAEALKADRDEDEATRAVRWTRPKEPPTSPLLDRYRDPDASQLTTRVESGRINTYNTDIK